MRDWDDEFANMAHVENAHALPAFWAARAAAYRESCVRIETDVSYGATDREVLDIVWPDTEPVGLAVFVHGGFWMRLDKSYWTDLAEGARSSGWAVCFPSYTLTPQARISDITRRIGVAIEMAATRVQGPIRLAGHSAGGHLVTRMLCEDTPLAANTCNRIEHTLSISGLHDLRPLRKTQMNTTLGLTQGEANGESPVLLNPKGTPDLTTWVGGGERPEFIRQARLLAMMWDGMDAQTRVVVEGDHNHFTILESLKDSASPITQAFIGETHQFCT